MAQRFALDGAFFSGSGWVAASDTQEPNVNESPLRKLARRLLAVEAILPTVKRCWRARHDGELNVALANGLLFHALSNECEAPGFECRWALVNDEWSRLSRNRAVRSWLATEAARLGIPNSESAAEAVQHAIVQELLPAVHHLLGHRSEATAEQRAAHANGVRVFAAGSLPVDLAKLELDSTLEAARQEATPSKAELYLRALELAADEPERFAVECEASLWLEKTIAAAKGNDGWVLFADPLARQIRPSYALQRALSWARVREGFALAALTEYVAASREFCRAALLDPLDQSPLKFIEQCAKELADAMQQVGHVLSQGATVNELGQRILAQGREGIMRLAPFTSSNEGSALRQENLAAARAEAARKLGMQPEAAELDSMLQKLASAGEPDAMANVREHLVARCPGLAEANWGELGKAAAEGALESIHIICLLLPAPRAHANNELKATKALATKQLLASHAAPAANDDTWDSALWLTTTRGLGFKAAAVIGIALVLVSLLGIGERVRVSRAAKNDYAQFVAAINSDQQGAALQAARAFLSHSDATTPRERARMLGARYQEFLLRRTAEAMRNGDVARQKELLNDVRSLKVWAGNLGLNLGGGQ